MGHLPTFPCRSCVLTFCEGKNKEGRPCGLAQVNFESKEDALKAGKAHRESPMMIGGAELKIGYWSPSGPIPIRPVRRMPSPTIHVGNLPRPATREDIREALKHLGDVAAVRMGASL